MNIGTTIKKYRHQRDLTQEQLAEYLNVSVSAVSQWEGGKTVPDVSTILALANFFDITLDELFDRTAKEKEEDLAKYYELDRQYLNKGEIKNLLLLWREATRKYPADYKCLIRLAFVLETTVYSGAEQEEAERNALESISICERILTDCNESNTRSSALQVLVHLHSMEHLSVADEDKAVKYAMMADSLYSSREKLLEYAYFTEKSKDKKKEIKHNNILAWMDLLTRNIYFGNYDGTEEKIEAYKTALKLWNTLIYDGNYLFYHCRIREIYLFLAKAYANLKKADEAVDALKRAFYHAKCYDSLPMSEKHFSSFLVSGATSDASKFSKNYEHTDVDEVMKFSKNNIFDFVRDKLNFDNM